MNSKYNFNLKIKYGAPEVVIVYEEYLITDFTVVLGSVGGTLGLFIGFSFFNIISYLIDISHTFISNSIKVISLKSHDISEKAIEVIKARV